MNTKNTTTLNKLHKRNGFTLVELIIVLVILAILAALLIPVLLEYVDKAKRQNDYNAARALMEATQAQLVEFYARNDSVNIATQGCILPDKRSETNKNKDVHAENSTLGKTVRELTGEEPYLFFVGLGHVDDYNSKENRHMLYTVYYAAYWRDPESTPIFYDGKNWTEEYPIKNSKNYTPGNIHFQVYVISNKNGWFKATNSANWTSLRNKAGYKP